MLDAHDPYPGVRHRPAVERRARQRAPPSALTAGLPPEVLGPPINVYRVCLHPDGLAARTPNFAEWAAYLVGQLDRSLALTGDPGAAGARATRSRRTRTSPRRSAGRGRSAATSRRCWCRSGCRPARRELSLFTTLTTFGTPRDVTLDELAVELFFPADEPTERTLRGADPA